MVLILIFLENALRREMFNLINSFKKRLNPYFFGKCSTAKENQCRRTTKSHGLNPYFFGKCSTALKLFYILRVIKGLNPYFFGKCSTARVKSSIRVFCRFKGGQPVEDPKSKAERVLILIFLENALRPSIRVFCRFKGGQS